MNKLLTIFLLLFINMHCYAECLNIDMSAMSSESGDFMSFEKIFTYQTMSKIDINGENNLVKCASDTGSYKRTLETIQDVVANRIPTGFVLKRSVAAVSLAQP